MPTRHENVACSLWRAVHQDWGLNFKETLFIHIVAGSECSLVSHFKGFLHLRSPQINESITHPYIFCHLNIIFNRKWRGFGSIENVQRIDSNFNLTCVKLWINGALINIKTVRFTRDVISSIIFHIGEKPSFFVLANTNFYIIGKRIFSI